MLLFLKSFNSLKFFLTKFFTDIEKENVPIQGRESNYESEILLHLGSQFSDENKLYL